MKELLVITLTILLTACGGGGGSSSGSGQNISGIYNASTTTTLNAFGSSITFENNFTLIIGEDGSILYQESGVTLASGSLNDNSFVVVVPSSVLNTSGVTCTGGIHYTGDVNGVSIIGTIASVNMLCNGTTATISGKFTASKLAKASYSSLMKTLQETLNSTL